MEVIKVEKGMGEYLVRLDERFDFGCVEEFRKCYESIPASGLKAVTIDFSTTRYMDSSALGMLINAKTSLTGENTKFSLVNCNDQLKKIFSISRFDKKFTIV